LPVSPTSVLEKNKEIYYKENKFQSVNFYQQRQNLKTVFKRKILKNKTSIKKGIIKVLAKVLAK
jgi:hypothetical protein